MRALKKSLCSLRRHDCSLPMEKRRRQQPFWLKAIWLEGAGSVSLRRRISNWHSVTVRFQAYCTIRRPIGGHFLRPCWFSLAITPLLRGMSGDPCLVASTHSVLFRHLLFLRARLEAIEAEQRRRAAAVRQAKLDRLWARSRSVQTEVSWVHTKMAVNASGDWAPVTAGPWAPRQDRSRSPHFRGRMSQSAALGP